jgi:hypothetical protein
VTDRRTPKLWPAIVGIAGPMWAALMMAAPNLQYGPHWGAPVIMLLGCAAWFVGLHGTYRLCVTSLWIWILLGLVGAAVIACLAGLVVGAVTWRPEDANAIFFRLASRTEAAAFCGMLFVALGSWLGAVPSFILTLTLWNRVKKRTGGGCQMNMKSREHYLEDKKPP